LRALANEYENLKFASFATYLANIAIDRSDSEMIEYRKMCQVIMDNCENAFALFDNLKKYCKIESTVDYEDLYNNDFKSLIGGKPTPNDNYQQETHSN
jgi:hypothetical protein